MKAFVGPLLQCDPNRGPLDRRLQLMERVLIAVDDAGVIVAMVPVPKAAESNHAAFSALPEGCELRILSSHQYLMPGLIDLHFHAPQLPLAGKCLHLPLETWLQQCTVPLEAKYVDPEWAAQVYERVVNRTLSV